MHPLRLAVLALLVVLFPASVLGNPIPDPSLCMVEGDLNGSVLVSPGPLAGTTLHVTVRDSNDNPFAYAFVEALLHPEIRPCSGATLHCITNQSGVCDLEMRAAGCILIPVPNACCIRANGVDIRFFIQVRSVDNGSHTSSLPDGSVNAVDLVYFAEEYVGNVPAGCHDYTNDGACNTIDLPYFGDAFKTAGSCTLD